MSLPRSQTGALLTGPGVGLDPLCVEGKAYLGGSYKGAPLSVAVAGPLGDRPFPRTGAGEERVLRCAARSGRPAATSVPPSSSAAWGNEDLPKWENHDLFLQIPSSVATVVKSDWVG